MAMTKAEIRNAILGVLERARDAFTMLPWIDDRGRLRIVEIDGEVQLRIDDCFLVKRVGSVWEVHQITYTSEARVSERTPTGSQKVDQHASISEAVKVMYRAYGADMTSRSLDDAWG